MRLREALHIDLSIRWISLMLFILCQSLLLYQSAFTNFHQLSHAGIRTRFSGETRWLPSASMRPWSWQGSTICRSLSSPSSTRYVTCQPLFLFDFFGLNVYILENLAKNLHRSARNTNPVKSTRWSSRSPRTWRQTGWEEERRGRVLSPLLLCGELCCLTAAAGLRRKTFAIMSTASSTLSPPPASAAPLSCAISSSLWGSLPPHVSKVTETKSLGFCFFFAYTN